jgi:hypothetical protein
MMSDESYAYVATEPCGCVTGAFADLEGLQKDLALQIGEWILRGAKVDRRSTEWVKANFRPCEKHSQPQLKQLDLFAGELVKP